MTTKNNKRETATMQQPSAEYSNLLHQLESGDGIQPEDLVTALINDRVLRLVFYRAIDAALVAQAQGKEVKRSLTDDLFFQRMEQSYGARVLIAALSPMAGSSLLTSGCDLSLTALDPLIVTELKESDARCATPAVQ